MERFDSHGEHGRKLPEGEGCDAIDTLKDRSNGEILAWLSFARSIEPDLRFSISNHCSLRNEIKAIVTLRYCSNAAVLRSLELARTRSEPTCASFEGVCLESSRQNLARRWTRTPIDYDAFVLSNQHHPCFNPNPYSIPATCTNKRKQGRVNETSWPKVRKRRLGNSDHLYWCTICGLDDPHSYKASDQWKKHEKEHEVAFACLPTGKLNNSAEGDLCALCGIVNPDDRHFDKHNVNTCLKAPEGPPTFKRRYEMVSHLQNQHACVNSEHLAERWRSQSQKIAWSCGFCIAFFTNLPDRLKHIGTEHFVKHQSLHEWSSTKIIEGLLLQPMIKEAWRAFLETRDPFSRENLSWDNEEMPNLQRRLELGVTEFESAEELAKAAYEAAEFDWISHSAVSVNGSDAVTDFRIPSLLANRANTREKPWHPASITPIVDDTKFSFPIAESASRSSHHAVNTSTPSLDTGTSAPDGESDADSADDEWPELYRGDDVSAASFCNDSVIPCSKQLLQCLLGDGKVNIQKDYFDRLSTDPEQCYYAEMQF